MGLLPRQHKFASSSTGLVSGEPSFDLVSREGLGKGLSPDSVIKKSTCVISEKNILRLVNGSQCGVGQRTALP